MNEQSNSSDHDVLVEMNANVKNLTGNFQAFTVANSQTTQDHETRLRVAEGQLNTIKGSQRAMRNTVTIVGIILALSTVVIGVISLAR